MAGRSLGGTNAREPPVARGQLVYGFLKCTGNATTCPEGRCVDADKFYFTFAAPSILL